MFYLSLSVRFIWQLSLCQILNSLQSCCSLREVQHTFGAGAKILVGELKNDDEESKSGKGFFCQPSNLLLPYSDS